MSDGFIIERYAVARSIWKVRAEKAHDGFAATGKRPAVPSQTWAEWFEWAFGMSLEEYAKLAQTGNHAQLVKSSGAVLADYRVGDRWYVVIGAPGESFQDLAESIQRRFPDIVEVKPHA